MLLLLLFFSMAASYGQKSYISGVITGLPPSLAPSNARILNGDFDGDGDQDLLYQSSNTPSANIFYLKNNNNGSFTKFDAVSGVFPPGTPFSGITFTRIMNPDRATTGQPFGQRVFDYDDDGDLDIFEIGTAALSGRILLQNAGNYTVGVPAASFPTALTSSVSRWITGDFDSDGDSDILYQNGNADHTGINLLRNDGAGAWAGFSANASGLFTAGPLNGVGFTKIGNNTNFFQIVFDADGDGDQDLYELSNGGNRYFARGASAFSTAPLPSGLPTSLSPAVFRIVAADFNHDSDIDFLYQTNNAPGANITYLNNRNNGTFTPTNASGGIFSGPNTPFGSAAFTLISRAGLNGEQIVMDLDGDNDMDILELSTTASSVLLQTGFTLPVKLESYVVKKNGNAVEVAWKTSQEINASHFIVEYSLNGLQFSPLEEVKAKGAGHGNEYTYLHRTPASGMQYYRLLQVDLDGASTTYSIKSIQFDGIAKAVRINPNKIKDNLTAYIVMETFRQVQLIDNTGRVLESIQISNQHSTFRLNMTKYASGFYYLRFVGNNTATIERVFKE